MLQTFLEAGKCISQYVVSKEATEHYIGKPQKFTLGYLPDSEGPTDYSKRLEPKGTIRVSTI